MSEGRPAASELESRTVARVTARLVPFLIGCNFVAYLDRVTGGIALINSIGNLAGFAGPCAVGLLKDATGSYTPGLLTLTAAGLVGTLVVLLLRHDPSLEHPPGP